GTLIGDVGENVTVALQPEPSAFPSNAVVTALNSFSNYGRIEFTSSNGQTGLSLFTGTITNASSGQVTFNSGAAFSYSNLNADFVNDGTVQVNNAAVARLAKFNSTY